MPQLQVLFLVYLATSNEDLMRLKEAKLLYGPSCATVLAEIACSTIMTAVRSKINQIIHPACMCGTLSLCALGY